LFPKERILANLQNKEFLADLLHEVVEIQAIERGVPVAQAHEIAMQARAEFLGSMGKSEKNLIGILKKKSKKNKGLPDFQE